MTDERERNASETPQAPEDDAENTARRPRVIRPARPAAAPADQRALEREGDATPSASQMDAPSPAPVEPMNPAADEDADDATLVDIPVVSSLRPSAEPPAQAPPHVGGDPFPSPFGPQPSLHDQPQGVAPWQAAHSWGGATLRVSAATLAGLSYLFWWVSGIIVYFSERSNRFVRFHAMQSIVLTAALTVFSVFAYILSSLCFNLEAITKNPIFHTLGMGIALLAICIVLFIWFAAMVAAWTGNYFRWPVVEKYAERYAAPPQEPPTIAPF